LLNNKKQLSNENINLIKNLLIRNKNVIIATARPLKGAQIVFEDIIFNELLLILQNGTQIYTNGEYIKSFDISDVIVRSIYIDIISKFEDIVFGFNYKENCFVNRHFNRHWDPNWDTIVDFSEITFLPSTKILIDLNNSDLKDYILEKYSNSFSIKITDNGTLCQIMQKGTSKYTAFKYLCDNKKMDCTKTICFGDDSNDIELFKNCKYPIAMENSIDELKTLAYFVTKSNDENGIDYFFNEFVEFEL